MLEPIRKETGLEKRLRHAWKEVQLGLRSTLLSAKAFGDVMLQAQEQLNLYPDGKLYGCVRDTTACKLVDTTLANWKRLAQNWTTVTSLVEVGDNEANLLSLTLREALALCKKTTRKSKKARPAKQTGERSSGLSVVVPEPPQDDDTSQDAGAEGQADPEPQDEPDREGEKTPQDVETSEEAGVEGQADSEDQHDPAVEEAPGSAQNASPPVSEASNLAAHLAHAVSHFVEASKCDSSALTEQEKNHVERLLKTARLLIDRVRRKLSG